MGARDNVIFIHVAADQLSGFVILPGVGAFPAQTWQLRLADESGGNGNPRILLSKRFLQFGGNGMMIGDSQAQILGFFFAALPDISCRSRFTSMVICDTGFVLAGIFIDDAVQQAFQNQKPMANQMVVGLRGDLASQLPLPDFFTEEKAASRFFRMLAIHNLCVSLLEQGARERRPARQFDRLGRKLAFEQIFTG